MRDCKTLPKLIAVVGPTTSGKTALGIELANRYGGEILSVDSRQVYRGMDIGTAKPDVRERIGIAHYGIDLSDPDELFSVADFSDHADRVITEMTSRGVVPFWWVGQASGFEPY